MHRQLSLLDPLLALVLLIGSVSSQSAPALLWSNHVHAPESLRLNTLVDQVEPNDLLAEYAKSEVPVVAFVQEDLNVEQFAANDAPFVSALFDNAQLNPVLFTNVKTPGKIYSSFKLDTSLANGNIVIYLPGKNLKENDDIIKEYTEKFNSSGPVVFMLTGENNELLKAHKRSARAADTPKAEATFSFDHKDCLLMYSTGATATFLKKDVNTKEEPQTITFGPPKLIDAKCSRGSGELDIVNWADSAQLQFLGTDEKNKLTVNLEFYVSNETGWEFTKIAANIEGTVSGSFEANQNALPSIPSQFSFSCQKTVIPLNESSSEYTGTIVIQGLQIQPFFKKTVATDQKYRFDDSSDCAVWFTLPIWMGLLVILLLIAILYFGVVALMSIITPDRFENPKGRGLIITNVEE